MQEGLRKVVLLRIRDRNQSKSGLARLNFLARRPQPSSDLAIDKEREEVREKQRASFLDFTLNLKVRAGDDSCRLLPRRRRGPIELTRQLPVFFTSASSYFSVQAILRRIMLRYARYFSEISCTFESQSVKKLLKIVQSIGVSIFCKW